VLTGAGISAESGIKTFRDADGLWEGHDVMQVASPQGWKANQELVLDFYNQRRKQLKEVVPNSAHIDLVGLEETYDVTIITQNVDDLHERAGSSKVVHLHGELRKVRSVSNPILVYDWEDDLQLGDTAEDGSQLRPHIVWFGEAVPMIETAAAITSEADILLIIGTSMAVYPAAGLVHFAPATCPIYLIDPKIPEVEGIHRIHAIEATATQGMKTLLELI
ncbi:MAG: NAD-dependent deacylase, partial [Saprospiraceae bacterium]|nr:NAD-dependent deacylase [Saprospiraceae bacterium]